MKIGKDVKMETAWWRVDELWEVSKHIYSKTWL